MKKITFKILLAFSLFMVGLSLIGLISSTNKGQIELSIFSFNIWFLFSGFILLLNFFTKRFV